MDDIKLNRVSIVQRLQKPKKDRNKKVNNASTSSSANLTETDELHQLQEPEEKIKLFERAVGYFNADTDETARKNALNQSVEKGPPYVCTLCQNWFYLGSKLKVHYILNHAYFHCEICSVLFENFEDKQTHLRTYHRPIFCEICQKDFRSNAELLQHYETEHNSSTCVFCGLLVQPKCLLQEHLTKKHQISEEYATTSGEVFPFIEVTDPPEFYCNLCRKQRSVDVMFGHMFSFHKMALTSLMNLLSRGCNIKCDGSSKDLIKCSVQTDKIPEFSKYFCPVCGLKYQKKFPEHFHLIYCQGRLLCRNCPKHFSSLQNREKHLKKCLNYKETVKYNENIQCNYCNDSIYAKDYDAHLSGVHKYKAQLMQNFKDTLFEVVDKNNKHIVVCCLCDENITLLTEQPKNIYLHYEKIHQMSPEKILQLCSVKPVLEDYEQLYREINEQILTENAENIKQESDTTDDDTTTPRKIKDYSYLEDEIESDFDWEETEILYDSENDITENYCEICGEDVTALIQHLSEHKVTIKHSESKITETNCDKCNKKYKTINYHVRREHEECPELLEKYGLKCQKCERKYWTASLLNAHELREHFAEIVKLKCFKCNETFSQKNILKEHFNQTHEDNIKFNELFFKCLQCEDTFPSVENIREHFLSKHPSLKIYKCPVPHCLKTSKRPKYLNKHLKSHNFKTKTGSRTCDVCKKEFKTFRAASIHKLMKHERKMYFGFQCRICQEKFQTMEQRKLHYSAAHPGQLAYTCLECGKGFISKSGLYGHRKIHQEHETLTCPYCNKEFTRRDSYNEHLLIHIGPRHQCPHCPKSFTQRSNLTRHVRIHTGAKPYQCTYCDKRFSDKGACRSHERVHTKEEHCECSYCGKKFTKKQKLKYHIKFHTGEGLVNCEICNKQFSNSYSLNEHRRIHNQQTLVMCNCGRGFTSEKYLQRHITNVHNDSQAKYVCPICFKTLLHKSSYNDHIMTHTSVKHIKCLLCNNEYNTKKTVKRHLFEKHKIDATGTELNKYIYQLKPEDVGLNVPSASEMEINVNDILSDKSLVSIDLSHLQKLETFKNKPKVTNTAKRAKMKEAYIANTLDNLGTVSNIKNNIIENIGNIGNIENIQIKEEPKSESEVESEDDVVLEARKKRKFKKPRKYKNIQDIEDIHEDIHEDFDEEKETNEENK